MALGAQRRRILWIVLRDVLALAALGLILGLAVAWAALPLLKSLVFGIQPGDPATALLAGGVLIAALLLAGSAPASAASRLDPLTSLRHE
jgi:ABC-type antimicrobial peptide transport system permease subunit